MVAIGLAVIFLTALFLVALSRRTEEQQAADWVLSQPDVDDWHDGLLSAAASGSDVQWQLSALEEILETGDSHDAARLREWMQRVIEAQ